MRAVRVARIYLVGLLAIIAILLSEAASLRTVTHLTAAKGIEQGKKEQKDKKAKKKDKRKAKVAGKAPVNVGTPAMWDDPGDVSELDLYWGIGGPDLVPKPPFNFDKEDMTGTNPKIKVIDANGVKWNLKFDEEVHAEVAASRIVWACGYMVEESYFVPSGQVQGVQGLTRARKWIGSDGSFTDGMFEKRPDTVTRRRTPWVWDSNPFTGTKEMSGLAILNVMLNNWDAKSENNNVLAMYDEDGTTIKEWYLVTDWGGTFGNMGGSLALNKSKWDVNDFRRQAFIDGVSRGELKLHYRGKMRSAVKSIPVEHARWFAGIIGQLTAEQLRAAFKAAGATEAEVDGFARRIHDKIAELKAAVGQAGG